MSVVRPSAYPEWADGGGAVIVAPTLAKRQLGWVTAEKPAGPYMNWWQNLVYQWIQYFDGVAGGFPYGDGSDGALTFDGTSTVAGITPVGNIYTLTRDIFATSISLTGASTVVDPGAYRIYCQGALTTSGGASIHANGKNGSTLSTTFQGTIIGTRPGGGQGNLGAGGNGQGALYSYSSPAGNGGSGAGGAGGSGNGVVAPPAAYGSPHPFSSATMGSVYGGGSAPWSSQIGAWLGLTGGCGGGGGAGDGGAVNAGGNGGGGGGVICIAARWITLANATDILAKGGNGNAASAGNAGGGGGGSGGLIIIATESINQTITAAQNAPGGTGGAGSGTGTAGGNGGNGAVILFNLAGANVAALPTAHEEAGVVTLTGVETSATATFNVPYAGTPGNVGGYKFSYAISRSDGIAAVPAILITSTATNQMVFTILDPFAGCISWRAWL